LSKAFVTKYRCGVSRPPSRNAFAVESAMHLNQSAAERAQNGRGDAVVAMAIDSEIWA